MRSKECAECGGGIAQAWTEVEVVTFARSEPERHFEAGLYICPKTKIELPLESSVPGPWLHWPVRVRCQACGEEHALEYADVRHLEPVFGHE